MTYNKRHKIHTLLTYMFLCANTYINKKKQFSQKVKSRVFCASKKGEKIPLQYATISIIRYIKESIK